MIKSLANTAETMHVLVGTYELQLLLNLSDQLSRRSRTFHFERYRSGQTADVKAFQNIIWNFQQRLPFPEQRDLREAQSIPDGAQPGMRRDFQRLVCKGR